MWDYCGSVEGTIGRQQIKIDELLAFVIIWRRRLPVCLYKNGCWKGTRV